MTPLFELQLGSLTWAPSLPALAASTVLLAVIAFTIGRARRRLAAAPAWRRTGVTLLNLVALLAVAALLAPPYWSRPASGSAVLLTEGADGLAAADAFVFGDRPGRLPEGKRLHTAGQLLLRRRDLDALQVVGHGLDETQWATLPASLAVDWTPPATPLTGVTGVRWPTVLEAGEPLVVTGTLRLPDANQAADVQLVDPAGVPVAALSVRSGQPFGLQATPRAAGALTYRLQVVRSDAILADDPVTSWVREPAGARLLVRQSAPSFDTRQLAAWAGDNGNPLVIHTQISRDRDLVQGINLPDDVSLELTPALLANTDLAVLDGRRWATLPDAERGLLLDSVSGGLGLLLLVDDAFAAWLETPSNAALAGVRLAAEGPTEPRWAAWRGGAPEQPVPVAPWRIEPVTASTLTVDEQGGMLETWQPFGAGRIAVSRLRERHRWATGGERSAFTRYWANVLRTVGRPSAAARWLAAPMGKLPRPGRRSLRCAQGEAARDLRLIPPNPAEPEATTPLSLRAHASGAPLRCGHIWPAEAGWHRLQLLGDGGEILEEIRLHVFGPDAWATDRLERRQAATRARATSPVDTASRILVPQPLSPWWPWSWLLVAAGLLWLERRLFELA